MTRQIDPDRSRRSDVGVCPQVAQPIAWGRETEISPGIVSGLCRITDIEDCDIGVSAGLRPGGPNYNVVSSNDGMVIPGVLIDRDHLRVSEQRPGPVIRLQQIAAHN